jgi:hypothetical protein
MATSVDQSMNSANSADATFMTTACSSFSGPVSDDFHAASLNQALWTFVNPLNDGSLSFDGFHAVLALPQGASHDVWTSGNQAIRLMQDISDGDFQVEVKLDSIFGYTPFSSGAQIQGILVEQDHANFLRFDEYYDGQLVHLFSASFLNGVPTAQLNTTLLGGPPHWLRVKRSGNLWTMSWSKDGTTFNTAVSYNYALQVTQIGPFAGNVGFNTSAPAFTALLDYFFNNASPIVPEDGVILSPSFNRIVIDPAAPAYATERGLADIDGDGRPDADRMQSSALAKQHSTARACLGVFSGMNLPIQAYSVIHGSNTRSPQVSMHTRICNRTT